MLKKFFKILIIFLILSIILIIRYEKDFSKGVDFDPIKIEFNENIGDIKIFGNIGSSQITFMNIDKGKYLLSNLPVYYLIIQGKDIDKQSFTIKINKSKFEITPQNFYNFFKKKKNNYYVSTFKNSKTINPSYKDILNWSSDFQTFKDVFIAFIRLLFPIFILIFFRLLFYIKPFKNFFVKFDKKYNFLFHNNQNQPDKKKDITLIIGFIITILIFVFLELRESYFFTQDDTFSQFFPVILQAMKDFFATWRLPTFNPIQFRGFPTFSVGYYSLANPVMYFSYFVATYILKNRFITMEVFALINFIIGYFGIYYLLKRFKLNPMILLLGVISYLYSGYNLISGRSWYYMLSAMAYSPYLISFAIDFSKKKTDYKWLIKVVVVSVLLFLAGNFQMWIYAMMFFSLYIIFSSIEKPNKKKILLTLLSFAIIFSFIFPILINQVMDCKIKERGVEDNEVFYNFPSLFLPYPILKSHDSFINYHPLRYTQMFYNGSVFNIIAFLMILYLVFFLLSDKKQHEKTKIIFENKFIILGLIALLLSFGKYGILNEILVVFPPFNKFTRIYKYLIFINMFFILSAALVLQKFFAKHKKTVTFILLIGYALIFYHIYITDLAFCKFTDKPYPKLPNYIQKLYPPNSNYRILGNAVTRSGDKNYVFGLQLNFASVYEIPSLTGYDIFENNTLKLPEKNLGKKGVRYVIDSDFKKLKYPMPIKPKPKRFNKMHLIYKNDIQKIYEIPDYKPLVAVNNKKIDKIIFTNQGIIFDISRFANIDSIFINYKYRKRLKGFIDGKEVKLQKTKNKSIIVRNAFKGKEFVLKYDIRLKFFILVSIIILILSIGVYFILKSKILYSDKGKSA